MRRKRDNNEYDRINNVYDSYMADNKFLNKWSQNNLGNQIILEERFNSIKSLLSSHDINLGDKKLLEVGCAGGNIIPSIINLGAIENNIYGIDLRANRLEDAKKSHPNARFSVMDAGKLKFPDNEFDVISAFTLFSSIIDPLTRVKVSKELYRVLKKGGVILYYDLRFNNPANKNVVGINENELNRMFPKMNKTKKLITVLPPLIRRLGKLATLFYPFLSKIPFLRSHYIAIMFK
jgi:ubiquinone/menaquinone biosynthesis C-methylase UbiE